MNHFYTVTDFFPHRATTPQVIAKRSFPLEIFDHQLGRCSGKER